MGESANTFVNVASSMGEFGSAGTTPATSRIPIEKNEAKIPAITTLFAAFLPKISEIKSVTKKVIGGECQQKAQTMSCQGFPNQKDTNRKTFEKSGLKPPTK